MINKNEDLILEKYDKNWYLVSKNGETRYYKNSRVYKPSFAGRNLLIGIVGGDPVFSNGVWFCDEGGPKY